MAFKNFKQTDGKWADDKYSGMTVKSAGCGPTSIADAVYKIDPTITPAKTAKWMEANGCACPGSGTYYSGMVKGLRHYGYGDAVQLNYTNIYGKTGTSYVKKFLANIKTGKYVGIACMGKSKWTNSGHYVFVYGYDGKTIKIYDPYNTKADCESTTKEAWEPYVKYLFLFSNKIETYKVKTTVKGVRVRTAPSLKAKTVKTLPKGTTRTIIKNPARKKWGRIKGTMHWIRLTHTKKA